MQPNHPRFLYPNALSAGLVAELSAEESTHALRVLRLGVGEEILLMDGRGTEAVARITQTTKKALTFTVLSVAKSELRSKVRLAFSIPKSGALDLLLRKVTEIGVDSFQPLISEHSLHPDSWNAPRWERIIAEACKQCQDPHWPICQPPLRLTDWLRERNSAAPLFFCDEAARAEKLGAVKPNSVDILVGAEGGWSESERQKILSAGVVQLGLGKNRLRAETAAIVAVTLVKYQLGEI